MSRYFPWEPVSSKVCSLYCCQQLKGVVDIFSGGPFLLAAMEWSSLSQTAIYSH